MVTVDQVASAYAYRQTSLTWNHTCTGSGFVCVFFTFYDYFNSAPSQISSVTYGGNAPLVSEAPSYSASFPGPIARMHYYIFEAIVGTNTVTVTLSANPLFQVKGQSVGILGAANYAVFGTGPSSVIGGGTWTDTPVGSTDYLGVLSFIGGAASNTGYSGISTSNTVLLSDITDTCPSASGFAYTLIYNDPGQMGSGLLSAHSTGGALNFSYGLTSSGSNAQNANAGYVAFYNTSASPNWSPGTGENQVALNKMVIFPPYAVKPL